MEAPTDRGNGGAGSGLQGFILRVFHRINT